MTDCTFHLSAMGLGDAVCGLYAACGLADLGGKVVFLTRHPDWFKGVSHPGLTVLPHQDLGQDANLGYERQLLAQVERSCPSRVRWYCRNLAAHLGIPEFAPARPAAVVAPGRQLEGDYLVVSPFSSWASREWPLVHWKRLCTLLSESGVRCEIVGETHREHVLKGHFSGIGCRYWWGQSAEWCRSAVANAKCVVGNDSGLVHVAGLYGVPAVAVMTHMLPGFVFGECAPTVRGVADADYPCLGCGWSQNGGYRDSCNDGCSALLGTSAGKVFREVKSLLHPLPPLPVAPA